MRSMTFVLVLLAAAACGGKEKSAPAQPAPDSNRIVIAAPAPPPPTPTPTPTPPAQQVVAVESETGVPECDEYLRMFDQLLARCEKELGNSLDAMKQSQAAMREAFSQWKTLDEESRRAASEAAAQGCGAAVDALEQSAQAMSCMID